MIKKITLSDVMKKDLRIIGYLSASWIVGLVAFYLTSDEKMLGLIPVVNYIIYRLNQELSNEGYVKVIKQ